MAVEHIAKYLNVLKIRWPSYLYIFIIIHYNSSIVHESKWLVYFGRWIIHKLLTLDKGKKPTNHENLGEIFRCDRVGEKRVEDMMMMMVKNNNDPQRKSGRPKEEMVHDFRRGLKTRNIIIYPVELNVFPLHPSSPRSIVKYSRRVS